MVSTMLLAALIALSGEPANAFRQHSAGVSREQVGSMLETRDNYTDWQALAESGQCGKFASAMTVLKNKVVKEEAIYIKMLGLWYVWGNIDGGDCRKFWHDLGDQDSTKEVFQFMAPVYDFASADTAGSSLSQTQDNYTEWKALAESGQYGKFASAMAVLKNKVGKDQAIYHKMLGLWYVWQNIHGGDCKKFWHELGDQDSAKEVFQFMAPVYDFAEADTDGSSLAQTLDNYNDWKALAESGQYGKFASAMTVLKKKVGKEKAIYDKMLGLWYVWRNIDGGDCRKFWHDVGDLDSAKEVFQFMAPVYAFAVADTSASSFAQTRDNYDEWQALAESGQYGKFASAMTILKMKVGKEEAIYHKMLGLWYVWEKIDGGDCRKFWHDMGDQDSAKEVFQFMAPVYDFAGADTAASSLSQTQDNYTEWKALAESGQYGKFASAMTVLKNKVGKEEAIYHKMLGLWYVWQNIDGGDCKKFWHDLGDQDSAKEVFQFMAPVYNFKEANTDGLSLAQTQDNYDEWKALAESGQCGKFASAMTVLKMKVGKEEAIYFKMLGLWYVWESIDAGDCRKFWQDLGDQDSAKEVFQFMAPIYNFVETK